MPLSLRERALSVMTIGEPILTSEITRRLYPDVPDCLFSLRISSVCGAMHVAEKWDEVKKESVDHKLGATWVRLK